MPDTFVPEGRSAWYHLAVFNADRDHHRHNTARIPARPQCGRVYLCQSWFVSSAMRRDRRQSHALQVPSMSVLVVGGWGGSFRLEMVKLRDNQATCKVGQFGHVLHSML